MANFATSIAEENEIIKAEDVTFGYDAAIDNVALALQGVLGASSGNYVIGGAVTPYSGGGLNVMIAPLYAYCASTGTAVAETGTTGYISLEEEEDADRIDIIEIQGAEEGYDYQVRMFNDPVSGIKTSESMNTKKRIALSFRVKKGTPGTGVAPSVDEGWVKLAEVEILASNSAIQESQIRNITARGYGEPNELWTADVAAAYNPGELTEAFSTFLKAHNEDGSHQENVIDENDIDWGTGSSQVNAKQMPVGQSALLYGNGGATEYASSESVAALLLALAGHINALYPFANNLLSRYSFAEVSPVAASTGNIDGLAGAMTIDGVAVSAGQAVLLKDQADKRENGIWQAATGAWSRYADSSASASESLVHKLILVTGGTENRGKVFYLAGDAYAIGTDELEFQESILSPYELAHKAIVRDSDGSISALTATGQVQGATLKSTGTTAVGGALSVGGASTLTGAVAAKSTLAVSGASTLTGAVTAGGNITASGYVKGAQIVVPTSQPSSLTNGSVWLTS